MPTSNSKSDTDLNTILHPPDYRPGWLHIALVGSELLGRVSPLALTPAWLALAAIACWGWADLRIPVAILSLALTVIDGSSLALLPRLERSFGPVTPPLLALTLVRTALTFAVGLLWTNWAAFAATAGVQIALTAAAIYATWIEPFRIQVTHAELHSPRLHGSDPPYA